MIGLFSVTLTSSYTPACDTPTDDMLRHEHRLGEMVYGRSGWYPFIRRVMTKVRTRDAYRVGRGPGWNLCPRTDFRMRAPTGVPLRALLVWCLCRDYLQTRSSSSSSCLKGTAHACRKHSLAVTALEGATFDLVDHITRKKPAIVSRQASGAFQWRNFCAFSR